MSEAAWGFSINYDEKKVGVFPGGSTVPTPLSLYKFYPVTDYHVESLESGYFYLPEHHQLNDPIDGSPSLVSMDSDPDWAKHIIVKYTDWTEEMLNEQRENVDFRRQLFQTTAKFLVDFHAMRMGITCFTEEVENQHFWSHYAGVDGFAIKYSTKHIDASGFFPVWYTPIVKPFDITEKKHKEILGHSLAFTKNKELWQVEQEWRAVVFPQDGKRFKVESFPFDDSYPIVERKLYFDKNQCIEAAYLGPRFFKESSRIKEGGFLKNEWKMDSVRSRLLHELVGLGKPIHIVEYDVNAGFKMVMTKYWLKHVQGTNWRIKLAE